MSVVAEYLFGSHARGDYNSTSDVDLLSITSVGRFRSFSKGKLNISFYPEDRFLEAASRGELFVMHIVQEAVLAYDSRGFDFRMRSSYQPKTNYEKEALSACVLGDFLTETGQQFADKELLGRRVAWCVRTILIAQSVNDGRPTFGPGQLLSLYPSKEAHRLLKRNSAENASSDGLEDLQRFLSAFRGSSLVSGKRSLREYWKEFVAEDNMVAKSTFRAFMARRPDARDY